ncbi:ABC transporter substrate-binding protein [Actinopolymorpha sp. B11F2]|uniref:ABC transporter substrate-binding protein n=1 Tax=Actinopolymorpha sp. B11F2 TaxID=3160862 RepID=UPI0032E44C82
MLRWLAEPPRRVAGGTGDRVTRAPDEECGRGAPGVLTAGARSTAGQRHVAQHEGMVGSPMAYAESKSFGRRGLVLAALGGAAAFGLSACGPDDDSTGRTPQRSQQPTTRDFKTAGGTTVEIPARPRRVVCTSYQMAAPLLDVGYTPAAAAEIPNLETFISGDVLTKYQALPSIGSWVEINIEKVLAAKPDLILVNGVPGYTDPLMKEYPKIAPALVLMAEKTSDWTKVAIQAADAVGRKAEAEKLRTQYTERAAGLKRDYADVLERTKWSMLYEVSYGEGQWSLLYPDGWIGVILQDIGVRFGHATMGQTGTGKAYSLEQLTLIDDSDVIVAQADNTGALVKPMRALTGKPGWENLQAVKAEAVFPMPNFYTVSYSSALAVLDTLEGILTKLRSRPS